ncbi:MAG TPA: pyridoxamine 5'-phosphate oxidase family protein [Caulobacteraceae bacterium]|nr:pyridoxamine 5'-phosphate oxidase family protein [Caulobacteraceae bacterium]
MSDDRITPAEAEERLWKALEDTRTGMLGLVGGEPQHFQPMTGFEEPEANRVWFFTRDDTDLARSISSGQSAMYTVVTKDTKVYACLMGELSVRNDRERIDKYWNPVVAAWYPEGKDDPHLTLLCFDLEDARLWLNDKGPVMFMYEVAKANLTKSFPDSGERADVTFQ